MLSTVLMLGKILPSCSAFTLVPTRMVSQSRWMWGSAQGPEDDAYAVRVFSRRGESRAVGRAVFGAATLAVFSQLAVAACANYEVLVKPTPEFNKTEAKASEFKKAQAKIMANWEATLARLNATEDSKELEMELKNMKKIIDDMHGKKNCCKRASLLYYYNCVSSSVVSCSLSSSQRSASMAAWHPEPAAVMACL